MSWAERDKRVLWHPFTPMQEWCAGTPLVIDHGDGNFLIDVDGNRFLDGVSSLWCNVHGHRHPRLDAALAAQAGKLAHSTFLGASHAPGIELAERLIAVAPPGLTRVFYSDSGSACVEIALKMAFQYCQLRGKATKTKFLRLTQAYHGDTLGAVGVGGIDLFHRVFGPLLVHSVGITPPYPRAGVADADILAVAVAELDEVLAARSWELAAIVVEPLMQGAAGMLTHVPGYLRELVRRCREHDVLVIVDEVATGFGRTGAMFACEHEDVSPDLMCVAKGITGGYLPLAATLVREEIYQVFLGERAEMKHFFHGHTYTANPLACAVAIESMNLLAESTLANARAIIPRLTGLLDDAIRPLPGVAEIRQRGMMIGIELGAEHGPYPFDEFRGREVCDRARAHGVLLRQLGDVVVWMPPLTLSVAEAELLTRATAAAILEVCG